MDPSAFEDHLDLFGGDIATWPAASRAEAATLLETSPRARAGLAATRHAEAFLRVRTVPEAGAVGSIAARAATRRQATPARRLVLGASWAAAAAILMVLGISLGTTPAPERDESPGRVVAAAFDTPAYVDVD